MLLDVIFPADCVACGRPVDGGDFRSLCPACVAQLAYVGPPAAVRFEGPARALVLALKYRRARHVVGDLERVLCRAAPLLAHVRGATLVPVPLHPLRERERGFNQSLLLARAMCRAAGAGTAVACLLRRLGEGPVQASLRREDRAANVKNAFALASRARLNSSLRYLIIDDVVTTGCTLESCAHVLRKAGCLNLDVATFALG